MNIRNLFKLVLGAPLATLAAPENKERFKMYHIHDNGWHYLNQKPRVIGDEELKRLLTSDSAKVVEIIAKSIRGYREPYIG